jgi:hypothetical protein
MDYFKCNVNFEFTMLTLHTLECMRSILRSTVDGRFSVCQKKCMRLFDDRRSNAGNQLTTCSFHCKYVDV